ncbi:MAG: extracellular solute-binding protein, partial [Candidatus Curtissbacteria bacterium]|nr:extracellular solute-binding protein [Candidatus Curtissbacteria bacterium]
GIRTAGAAIGTVSNIDQFSDLLALMIMQNGGDLNSPTDNQSADALKSYVSFAQGANKVWDEQQPPSTVAFSGGNVAMYFGPSWRAIEIKNANPQLKFKVAPVPQLEGNRIAWANYWANGVSVKSVNKEAAWEFASYLAKEEVLIKRFSENAKSPNRFFGEPYPLVSMAPKLASDPILGAFISDAPLARSFPMASRTFDNGLNDQIIKAYEDAVNSVIKGADPKSALGTTAKNVNQILTKFGAK